MLITRCSNQIVKSKIKDYTVHLDKEIQHLIIESFKTEKPLHEQIEVIH